MTFIIFKDELSVLLDVLKEKQYNHLSIIVEATKEQNLQNYEMYKVTFSNYDKVESSVLLAIWAAGYLYAEKKYKK